MSSEVSSRSRTAFDDVAFTPHHCFACGTLNTNGLHLDLHLEPGRSWTETALDRRFEGWEGVVHGGILCAILDEVMAWALVAEDHWGVTSRMEVAFRRPVTVELPIRAEGWIVASRRRIIDTAARIVDPTTGTELATATGQYVAAGAEKKAELQARYGFRRLALDGSGAPRIASTAAAQARAADLPEAVDR